MAIDKNKCNPELGFAVREHLRKLGILNMETCSNNDEQRGKSIGERKAVLEENFRNIISTLGMNLQDGNLTDTPRRLAKLWLEEMFWGLDWSNFPKCTAVDQEYVGFGDFVLEKNIKSFGCCSHHFLSMFGIDDHGNVGGGVTVAYIPKNKVLGLSKINRVVQFCMARPGTQEQYCRMIAEVIKFVTDCDSVAVMCNLKHLCVMARGACDNTSSTYTFYATGEFETNSQLRTEFLSACK